MRPGRAGLPPWLERAHARLRSGPAVPAAPGASEGSGRHHELCLPAAEGGPAVFRHPRRPRSRVAGRGTANHRALRQQRATEPVDPGVENPLGKTADELDDCATLGVYYITYVPANSTLTIDGMRESSQLRCPGFAVSDAATQVYGPGAGPLEHITLSCGVTHTVCADVDTEYIAPDATLSVSIITREL